MLQAVSKEGKKIHAAIRTRRQLPSGGPVRILFASHSHPQLTKGGAEISAFQLFSQVQNLAKYDSWFLGCNPSRNNQKLGAIFGQPFTDREYVYSPAGYDWFKFANTDPNFPQQFRTLLKRLKPQLIHFHHYITLGLEAFLHTKETLPSCKIVLTLHEFLAVCHHFGQMIKKQDRTLCHESSPAACASCFEEIPPADFFLRKLYIQRFFELVDHFIAPSQFLAERYISWGVPRNRMSVIENVVPMSVGCSVATAATQRGNLLRVGFFGQISFLKGINVLFEAADILRDRKIDNISFEIYGDYKSQPPEFQADFLARLGKAGRNVKFNGAYDQSRVDALMQSVDVILMPSIWWENSPVVIQEAFRNRRPVICSDIGGMAEKIRDGEDGFHFPAGNSTALSSLLKKLAKAPSKLTNLKSSMKSPSLVKDILKRHTKLYASLLD